MSLFNSGLYRSARSGNVVASALRSSVEQLETRVLMSTSYAATSIGVFNPAAINAAGDVAGTTSAGHAVLYQASSAKLTDLETTVFANSGSDTVYGINAGDTVVLSHKATAGGTVTYWAVKGASKIAVPGATDKLFINTSGQIAGTALNNGETLPALWTDVAGVYKMNFLPTLDGSTQGSVAGLNDSGHVTGTENTSSPDVNSTPNPVYLASATGITNLPAANSFILQETSNGIGNNGWVVGTNWIPPKIVAEQATLWEGDVKPIFLGSLAGATGSSQANGVNTQGVVIGTTATATGVGAFVWTSATGMKLLASLTTGLASNATLLPVAINDSGVIVGVDANSGAAMLLKPGTALPTTGSINGTIFNDLNNNGTLDAGEKGVAGATVFLNLNGTGNPTNQPQTQTGTDGLYSFSNVKAGSVEVEVIAPAGYADGKPGAEAPVTVAGGQDPVLNRAVVVAAPVAELSFNHVVIANGETTPLATNGTAFGSVPLGQTKTVKFVVFNPGNLPLILSGSPKVVISGVNTSEFKIVQEPYTPLDHNILTWISVEFSPTVASTITATLTLKTNDPKNPTFKFTINGTGFQSTVLNGTYNGAVKSTADGTLYPATLIFSAQNTKAGTIQGTLTIPTYGSAHTSGTFKGSVAATGKFTFTRATALATATLTGQESSDGKILTGTLKYDTLLGASVFTFLFTLA